MTLRPDLNLIAHLVPGSSRVLDLGCGDGTLLHHLISDHDCTGTGVEIDPDKVRLGIQAPREIPVFRDEVYAEIQQGRAESGLETASADVDAALDGLTQ